MDFGHAIKTLRQERNMTQAQLAERCSVSDSTVSDWERGGTMPPNGALERICNALGVPTPYLVITSIEEREIPAANRVAVLALLRPLRDLLLDKEP